MKATQQTQTTAVKTVLTLVFAATFLLGFGQITTERFIVRMKNDNSESKAMAIGSMFSEKQLINVRSFRTAEGSSFMTLTLVKEDGADYLNALRNNENVLYAEKDEVAVLCGEEKVTPTDAQYYKQWAMQNNGNIPFTASKKGADIEMENAWAIEQGDSSVIVAIIDTGVKWNHPDFNGRMWVNRAEIPANGLDDDANGLVDDFQGWDFADKDADPMDENGHGTNIASIIGANANNTTGFAGMDWNCKLMNLKVMNQSNAYYSWWIEAIYYAVDHGAKVLNMSLGGETESQALTDAVNYALSKNVIVVVGMGNNATNKVSFPANVPGVIAVGSTDPDDTRSEVFNWSPASGSNFGPHISVVAPGSYIYGLSHKDNNDFNTYFSGTSQATAYVSGLASLLRAQLPDAINTEIKELIEKTAEDKVGDPSEDKEGKDDYYGFGRINAYSALLVNAPLPFELKEEDVKIYPNPSNGDFFVNYPEEVEKITVTNAMGLRIKEFEAKDLNGTQLNVDVNGYVLVTFRYQDQAVTKKVVIIH
jgi:thermitase